jgi:hypothetical protein
MLASLGATGDIRGRVQTRDVVMIGKVWRVLSDLPAWRVTQIPRRRPLPGRDCAGGQDQAGRGAARRLRALVSRRLADALAGFRNCRWLRGHFYPVTAGR